MISQTFVVMEEGTITYKINASKIHR